MTERGRRGLGILLRLAVTLGALAWVGRQVELGQARALMAQAPVWAFVVPVLGMLFNSWLHALRVRLILAASGHPLPLAPVYSAMLKGLFVGLVLPTGGSELVKAGFLGQLCGRVEPALAAMGAARVLELVPWCALLLLALAGGLPAQDPALGAAAAVLAAGFGGVIALAAVGVRWGPGLAARLPGRLGRAAHAVAAAAARLPASPSTLGWALGLAVPFILVNIFVVYVTCLAYGLQIRYIELLTVVPVADGLISLPVTISGVGVREGVMARALAPYGAAPTLAVAIALTRWTGELGRAALGGVLLWVDRGAGRGPPPTRPPG